MKTVSGPGPGGGLGQWGKQFFPPQQTNNKRVGCLEIFLGSLSWTHKTTPWLQNNQPEMAEEVWQLADFPRLNSIQTHTCFCCLTVTHRQLGVAAFRRRLHRPERCLGLCEHLARNSRGLCPGRRSLWGHRHQPNRRYQVCIAIISVLSSTIFRMEVFFLGFMVTGSWCLGLEGGGSWVDNPLSKSIRQNQVHSEPPFPNGWVGGRCSSSPLGLWKVEVCKQQASASANTGGMWLNVFKPNSQPFSPALVASAGFSARKPVTHVACPQGQPGPDHHRVVHGGPGLGLRRRGLQSVAGRFARDRPAGPGRRMGGDHPFYGVPPLDPSHSLHMPPDIFLRGRRCFFCILNILNSPGAAKCLNV